MINSDGREMMKTNHIMQLPIILSLVISSFLQYNYSIVNSQSTSGVAFSDMGQSNYELKAFLSQQIHQGEKFIILPLLSLGLANRLRIIASLHTIAKVDDRKLIVLWQPTADCNCSFSDIFQNRNKNTIFYSLSSEQLSTSTSAFTIDYQNILAQIFLLLQKEDSSHSWKRIIPRDFFVDINDFQSISVVVFWTYGIHAPENILCEDYLETKSLFYQNLKPSKSVDEIISKIIFQSFHDKESLEGARTVGVHVRAYHSTYDWPVVVPLTGSTKNESTDLAALRFDESAPLHAYTHVMNEILKNYPKTLFFVSSNSFEVKTIFSQIFGGIVVTVESPPQIVSDRSSPEGMVLAASEFLLLGRI